MARLRAHGAVSLQGMDRELEQLAEHRIAAIEIRLRLVAPPALALEARDVRWSGGDPVLRLERACELAGAAAEEGVHDAPLLAAWSERFRPETLEAGVASWREARARGAAHALPKPHDCLEYNQLERPK